MPGVPDLVRREKAFQLYSQYRNVSKISKELKIPTQTLFNWKKQDKWDEKLANLKKKLIEQHNVIQKAKEDVDLQRDLEKLNLLEVLEQQVSDVLISRKVEISNWKDLMATLEFITKEKRLIMGEPTERGEQAIDVTFMNETDLDNRIEDLKRFMEPANPVYVPISEPVKDDKPV